jgi:gluconolactonase
MRVALACLLFSASLQAQTASIDLMTREGVAAAQGTWRYSDVRIVEVDFPSPSGAPSRTWDFTPHAGAADFDDASWEILDPPSLDQPRAGGKVCFNWYRIRVTLPERVGDFDVTGSLVTFDTIVDDYAEVWVNGSLPRDFGQSGGSVVKGFNAPNTVVLTQDARPGQTFVIAVFGINGPISDAPGNYIFFRHARLDFFRLAKRRAM